MKEKMFTATGKLIEVEKPKCLICKSESIKGKRLDLRELLSKMAELGHFSLFEIFYLFKCNDCKMFWIQIGSLWWDEYYKKAGFKFEGE